jgi:hypothetical protein
MGGNAFLFVAELGFCFVWIICLFVLFCDGRR